MTSVLGGGGGFIVTTFFSLGLPLLELGTLVLATCSFAVSFTDPFSALFPLFFALASPSFGTGIIAAVVADLTCLLKMAGNVFFG